jgi:hypothetical protein
MHARAARGGALRPPAAWPAWPRRAKARGRRRACHARPPGSSGARPRRTAGRRRRRLVPASPVARREGGGAREVLRVVAHTERSSVARLDGRKGPAAGARCGAAAAVARCGAGGRRTGVARRRRTGSARRRRRPGAARRRRRTGEGGVPTGEGGRKTNRQSERRKETNRYIITGGRWVIFMKRMIPQPVKASPYLLSNLY